MEIIEYIRNNITYFSGAMGTFLQKTVDDLPMKPEMLNLTRPEEVVRVHKAYLDAGSNIIETHTFGANSLKYSDSELEEIIKNAVLNAKRARDESKAVQRKFIALEFGPTGKMIKPYGDLDFEDAVSIFAKSIKIGVKYGVDAILLATQNDIYETKAAVIAAKENSDLPIFVSNSYCEDGKLMTGSDPCSVISVLEGLGVDAIGINCSFGPKESLPIINEYIKYSSLPLIMMPNAGLPRVEGDKTFYDVDTEDFAKIMLSAVKKGVRIVGGCCGTDPEYISSLVRTLRDIKPVDREVKNFTCASSAVNCVFFGEKPILIGERINPTGKKRLKQAIVENDISYILNEGISQQDEGADIIDVNVGLPEIKESEVLPGVVEQLQTVVDSPLQIDTSDIKAMEKALRRYRGKAIINSVNGKEESMREIFPLVRKYGGLVIALTLDENGIPDTAEQRVNIAKKIVDTAKKYGIQKKDIIFDTLAMTISSNTESANVTLKALSDIKNKLGCHTSLGISNISFGLPQRGMINSMFLLLALQNGLSAAIINTNSADIMGAYYSYLSLKGMDEGCKDYIDFAEKIKKSETETVRVNTEDGDNFKSELQRSIIKGLKDSSKEITKKLLSAVEPMDIVQNEIMPALNIVGEGYEEKRMYLPQLLMSAEASSCAFEEIKKFVIRTRKGGSDKKSVFVLATVKGDIHDIGKNIVKLLLENYGFKVVDLGKDVKPEKIVETVSDFNAPVVGLSALMTTTVPAMEETIKLLREKTPWCKVVVGGAVLNEEYAKNIGADKYAKDAMQTIRYAQEVTDK